LASLGPETITSQRLVLSQQIFRLSDALHVEDLFRTVLLMTASPLWLERKRSIKMATGMGLVSGGSCVFKKFKHRLCESCFSSTSRSSYLVYRMLF